MNNNKLAIRMRLTSPLHISSPRLTYWDASNGQFSSKSSSVVATRNTSFPLAIRLHHELLHNGNDSRPAHNIRYPIIPANTLRGRLRRMAAERIFAAIRSKGERLSLDAVHVLTCGASSGRPEGGPTSLDDRDIQVAHPYFSTFGGGPKLFRSGFQVASALPVNRVTIDEGYVPVSQEPYATTQTRTSDFFFGTHIRRGDDVLDFVPDLDDTLIANYPAVMKQWIAACAKNKDDRAADRLAKKQAKQQQSAPATETPPAETADGSPANVRREKTKKSILESIVMCECVVPGTVFYSDITFSPWMSDAAKGCLMHAVFDAMQQPIGGKVANGLGRFLPEMMYGETVIPCDAGSQSDEIMGWIDAYDEWLSGNECSAAALDSICKGE